MTRRQITLTTGSGHRRGHEDCGLGRLPGRKLKSLAGEVREARTHSYPGLQPASRSIL